MRNGFRRTARSMRRALLLTVLLAGAIATGCRRTVPDDPQMVADITRTLYGVVRVERLGPPVAARLYAYASTALYLGMASADPARPDVKNLFNGLPEIPRAARAGEVDPTLTALAAERVLLDSMLRDALPTTRSAVARLTDSLVAARMAVVTRESVHGASRDLGERIANLVVAWAHGDGFDTTRGRPYKAPVGPAFWVNDNPASTYTTQNLSGASTMVVPENPANARRPGNTSDRGLIMSSPKAANRTLPAVNMAGATEPYWGYLRTFALASWDACAVPAVPPFSTKPGSPIYEDAKVVFETARALTPAERTTALYWADNAGETGTPGGHWLSIAAQMVGQKGLSAIESARLSMATSIAVADAFISSWRVKFIYNVIRPRTYIRRTMDPKWEPAISTPPFPEYVSGHSALSAAAATTIAGLLGDGPFIDSTSISLGHTARSFNSYMDAAREAGESRIFAGIHFPSGNVEGRNLGTCVGNAVIERIGLAPRL
jgi:hypothetical protein